VHETNKHHGYVRAFATTTSSQTDAAEQTHALLLQFVDATSRKIHDSIQLNLAISAGADRKKYVTQMMTQTHTATQQQLVNAPTDYMFEAWPELLQEEKIISAV
jgi:hypothetical protein